ncbi:MAG: tail fiber domain-containing protein [Bacteroidales bacterium]|nr:tail fiber domain-containing protein [Bacteroidales bacterium]
MKRFLLLTIFVLSALAIRAQSPLGFNYQGVARDAEGNVLAGASMTIRIGIMSHDELVWQEDHSVETNALGMFALIIGDQAAPKTGGSVAGFEEIPWDAGAFELSVSVDPGSGFIDLGRSDLMSVPFALYAQHSPHTNQSLELLGTELAITGGNSVDLSPLQDGVIDADADPENEIQDLTFSNGMIQLSQDPGSTAIDLDTRIGDLSGWKIRNDTVYSSRPVAIDYKNPETREPLFEVKNDLGNPVFAVYNDGVVVYVDESKKGIKGGFAVGGYNSAKGTITQKYAHITPDSVMFWVPETPDARGVKGGFAVGGYNTGTKGPGVNLLEVSSTHTRIQFDTANSKGVKGGFAVGGYNTGSKAAPVNLMSLTQKNYMIGENAGWLVDSLGGKRNLFIGYEAGYNTTTGSFNSFIGYRSGYANTVGNYNSFVGYRAGLNADAFYNTFFGFEAGLNNTSGKNNIAIGYQAGYGGEEGITGLSNIFIGLNSGFSNTTGSSNIFMGTLSGTNNLTGQNNIFIGNGSGSRTENGNYNTYIGYLSGENAGNGITNDPSYNTFLGYQTGRNNVSGAYNTYIGYNAGYSGANASGSNNVMIGDNTGFENTSGYSNVFLGNSAGRNNTTGFRNVFIGTSSGYSNTTGQYNAFLGYLSGENNTTGTYNSFFGYRAGRNNSEGDWNAFYGFQAGYFNTLGENNSFFGPNSGFYNTTGNNNSFLGYFAGFNNTTGNNNTFIGYKAGFSGASASGINNVFIGVEAGYSNTLGSNNVGIGNLAGRNNTTGQFNVYLGTNAGNSNQTANYNTLIGYRSGQNTTAGYNTMVGYNSGILNTNGTNQAFYGYSAGSANTGSGNTFLGAEAGYYSGEGRGNVYIGTAAGRACEGSYNVFIGRYAGYREPSANNNKLIIENNYTNSDNANNALIYGDFGAKNLRFNATVGINRTDSESYGLVVDGGSSTLYSMLVYKGAYAFGNGFVSASDISLKSDIKDLDNALGLVESLRGVSFSWKDSQDLPQPGSKQIGLIAQEVEMVLPEVVTENAEGLKGIAYDKLTAVLIEAVKEQQVQIEALKAEQEHYRDLEERLRLLEEQLGQ